MIDANRSRLRSDIDSSMLSVCTAPECKTIVFGHGTCVAHDPPRSHPADTLLVEANGRIRAARDFQRPATTGSTAPRQ